MGNLYVIDQSDNNIKQEAPERKRAANEMWRKLTVSTVSDFNSFVIVIAEATPKQILQLMGVDGLSISHVKSHLQVWFLSFDCKINWNMKS